MIRFRFVWVFYILKLYNVLLFDVLLFDVDFLCIVNIIIGYNKKNIYNYNK